MQVGISSAVFYPMETELAVEKIIQLGFKRTELFINCESEYDDLYIDKLKEKMDGAGIQVVSIHPYTSLIEGMFFFSEYDRRVQDSISQYRKYFRAAERLGAKYFTFHGNRSLTGTVSPQTPIDRHCEVIEKLSDAASDYGIVITQENVSWCSSQRPEYLKTLRENLGKKIGFTLDLKQARRAGVEVNEYIDAMGENLMNIHISDYSAEEVCLLPGFGEIDYVELFKKLNGINYNGDLIIEVYSSNYNEISQIKTAKEVLENKMLQK